MGLVALFEDKKPKFGSLIFDASFREAHAVENEITDEPVADSSEVTTFVITRPRQLVITVGVSSHPDKIIPQGSRTRHIDAWHALKGLSDRHEIAVFVTTLETYPRMLIQRVGTLRTKESGESLMFEVIAKQISFGRIDQAENLASFIRDRSTGTEDADLQSSVDIVR